ncbi:hypothetical protein LCGC14_1990270, partial [marine sediment metagenome]
MNWYRKNIKVSYNRGIPISEEYDQGRRPLSTEHKQDPRSLVIYDKVPGPGRTRFRKGFPKGFSMIEDEETNDNVADLPSEPTLMDQDPPTGEGANDERFVDDPDKMPIIRKNDPIGPHNMQGRIGNKDVFDFVS